MKFIHKFPGILVTVLAALTFGTLSGCTDHEPTIVGWWSLDGPDPSTAIDSTPYGNHGKIHNGEFAPGLAGDALLLDGADDSIVVIPQGKPFAAFPEGITISVWTFRTQNRNVALVARAYPSLFFGFHGMQFKWQVRTSAGKRADCYADKEYVARLNEWHHVAATFDGYFARLYANGEEICSDFLWGELEIPAAPFTLGAYYDQDGEIVDELPGYLDDVRIYSGAMTPKNIRKLFESTGPDATLPKRSRAM